MKLTGKVALVTGGGGGIGGELCRAMARQGAVVAVNDVRADRVDTVTADIVGSRGRAVAALGDVTNARGMRSIVDEVVHKFGSIDILVTCAANYGRRACLDEMEEGEWASLVNCHLNGTAYAIQAVIPNMKKRSAGRIVTFSSTVGFTGMPTASHHAAAKAGIKNLTKSAAAELAPFGITVNCISPTYTDTDFLIGPYTDEQRAAMASVIPLGRMGKPSDMVEPLFLFVGTGGDFITGEVLHVDGGRTLSYTRPWH